MLVVGSIGEVAADFSGVRVGLEAEVLAGLQDGGGVGVDPEFVEEDGAGQCEGSPHVQVAGQVLGDYAFVNRWQDGQGGSVPHHLLELAVVRDIHLMKVINYHKNDTRRSFYHFPRSPTPFRKIIPSP